MKENKTQATRNSVQDFLASVEPEALRHDSTELTNLMQEATGVQPVMWGSSIIGFGTHHYVYETGREGDTVAVGFAPRKKAITIYGLALYEQNAAAIEELGKIERGKGCVYIKHLADVDVDALSKMIKEAFQKNNTK